MARIGINMGSGTLQAEEVVVGIDLGTTNSLIAYMHPDKNAPVSINDLDKGVIVPSIIHFDEYGNTVVGEEAKEKLKTDPSNTIYSVKRLLGKSYKDINAHSGYLGYKIIDDNTEGLVKVRVGDRFYTPIELSAEILKDLRSRAEHALKTPVNKVVITVPAYFNDAQRQATRDAGKLAGLEVLRIVNEPTAASLAYGIGLDGEEKTVVVYDLGGGTFDVSVLKLHSGIYEVLSTHGDTWLGGDDFDRAIINHWLEEKNIDVKEIEEDKLFGQTIRLEAEKAKKHLSDHEEFITEDFTLTKTKFDALISPIVKRTIESCTAALSDAGLSKKDIDEIVLVGGSTRVPLVYNSVSEFFDKKPHNAIDPDQVVALGAAIQADVLAGNRTDVLLLDVTPLSLGLETMGGLMDVIVPRNSKIPTKAGRQYTTQVDGQVNMKISVYQGERDMVEHNRKLAEFDLKGIPSMPAGLAKIDVNFILNADGILKIEAIELRSGVKQVVEVKPQYGLTDGEVEQMLIDSLENAKDDIGQRALIEARTASEQLIYHTTKFIEKHTHLLNKEEIEGVKAKLKALKKTNASDVKDAILKGMDDLDDYTKDMAERVMDHSIAEAMKGKKIND